MLNEVHPLLFSAGVAGAALLAALTLYVIVAFLLKRWLRKISIVNCQIELQHLRPPLSSLLPAFCMRLAMPWVRLPDDLTGILSHAISLWLIASFGWLAVKAMRVVRDVVLSRYDINVRDNLEARRIYTQLRVIENIINVLIVLLTISLMLVTFQSIRQVGVSILASAGIMGIIIGFAAQKTLGNFIAGLQIALSQPIRVDDVVIVEGEWGRIEEITLTYVVIRIWDLRRLVVPISYFIENPFQNWTRTSADLLGSVFIYADYTLPVSRVREELTRILENSPHWDKKVNVVHVTDATENTVEIRALMSTEDSSSGWELRCEVREKLLEFLQREFPQHLPKTRVQLNESKKTPANASSPPPI